MEIKHFNHGDTVGSVKVKGSRNAFCPSCNMFLPHLFLVLEDNLQSQTMGYTCSLCKTPNIGLTRSKVGGITSNHFVVPGFEYEEADYLQKKQAGIIK